MKVLASSLAGAIATVTLTLLLAALAPRPATVMAQPGPVRPLLRAPEEPPDLGTPASAGEVRAGHPLRPMANAVEPARPDATAHVANPRRSFAALKATQPLLAAATAPRTAVVWPARTAWPSDALAGVSLPVGDRVAAGGAGAGDQGGTGGAGATPAPPPSPPATLRAPGITRRAIAEYAPQPAYPASLRAREESGFVETLVHLDATGRVSSIEMVSSSGSPVLEEAVRATVLRWRFSPALRDGTPVATTIRRRFEFRMVER